MQRNSVFPVHSVDRRRPPNGASLAAHTMCNVLFSSLRAVGLACSRHQASLFYWCTLCVDRSLQREKDTRLVMGAHNKLRDSLSETSDDGHACARSFGRGDKVDGAMLDLEGSLHRAVVAYGAGSEQTCEIATSLVLMYNHVAMKRLSENNIKVSVCREDLAQRSDFSGSWVVRACTTISGDNASLCASYSFVASYM